VLLSDGSVRNAYNLKIVNRANYTRDLVISVDGPEAMIVSAAGEKVENGEVMIAAPGDAVRSVRIFATLPEGATDSQSLPVIIHIRDLQSGDESSNPSVFMTGRQ